jgi:hypothetical protein
MAGETDLKKLLTALQPHLHEGEFVFVTVDEAFAFDPQQVIATFKEAEGMTLVLPKSQADVLKLEYDFVAAWITLQVCSSLQAVGLTAGVATALAEHGISCNVIAAYHHDHLFVDDKDANAAMQVLRKLAEREQA